MTAAHRAAQENAAIRKGRRENSRNCPCPASPYLCAPWSMRPRMRRACHDAASPRLTSSPTDNIQSRRAGGYPNPRAASPQSCCSSAQPLRQRPPVRSAHQPLATAAAASNSTPRVAAACLRLRSPCRGAENSCASAQEAAAAAAAPPVAVPAAVSTDSPLCHPQTPPRQPINGLLRDIVAVKMRHRLCPLNHLTP